MATIHRLPLASASQPSRAYRIEGGRPLRGRVTAAGAKNAVTKQLVASLLTDEPCVLENVPEIAEIGVVLEMLGELGTTHEWVAANTLRVHTPSLQAHGIGLGYLGVNRIPVLMIGPLLHRVGRASVPAVGGCRIGTRPIDFHLASLRAMGADIESTGAAIEATAQKRLRGTTINLPYPSVGATENTLLAAVLADGATVIEGAATEPEVVDTILMLQKMGALVAFAGDRTIVIEGVPKLHGARHQVISDRIEVASFALAGIASGGEVAVANARHEDLVTFLSTVRKLGGDFRVENGGITFSGQGHLRAIQVETDVHPGFMTDWQQPLVAALTQAEGVSVVHETVFEERFGYTEDLRRMGAVIDLSPGCLGGRPCRFEGGNHLHSCLVSGPTPLEPARLVAPDLRGGIACVLGALLARGTSEVHQVELIERGYSSLPEKLAALGASVQVVDGTL
jgi:UDP-N-acetylglucosamine 1-carboxyvinyltransferase